MGGTFDALPWVRRLPLDAAHKSLLYAISSYVDEDGTCYPSQATLAADAGLGVRTVRRYLAEFDEWGITSRKHRGRAEGKGRGSDLIRLNIGTHLPAAVAARSEAFQAAADDDLAAKSDDQAAADDTPSGQAAAREQPENHQTEQPEPPPRSETSDPVDNHVSAVEAAISQAADTITATANPRKPHAYLTTVTRRLRAEHGAKALHLSRRGMTVPEITAHIVAAELGANPDSYTVPPDCPDCDGTGWADLADDGIFDVCPCSKAAV